MIVWTSTQDSTRKELGIPIKQVTLINDSVFARAEKRLDSIKAVSLARTRKNAVRPQPEQSFLVYKDSICTRSPIADITFHDPDNLIFRLKSDRDIVFFNPEDLLAGKSGKQYSEIIYDLRTGQPNPSDPVHKDWIIMIVFLIALLLSFIRDYLKAKMPQMMRTLSLRGINDPAMRNTAEIFQWQSTLLNFVSFLGLGIFAWYAGIRLNLVPPGLSGFALWLGIIGIIVTVVTIRHLICILAGRLSEKQEVFNEYLTSFYQFLRAGALLLVFVVILHIYTGIIGYRFCIFSGFAVLSGIYLLRVSRLLLIFVKRRISLFYLILYLCALEILPVLVTLKYTGLI